MKKVKIDSKKTIRALLTGKPNRFDNIEIEFCYKDENKSTMELIQVLKNATFGFISFYRFIYNPKTQNRTMLHLNLSKNTIEDLLDKKPSYFKDFSQAKFDELEAEFSF